MQTAIARYRSACILKFSCGLHRKLQNMLDSWIFRDWVKNWGHVVNCGLLCHGVNVSCSHWHQAWPAWNSLAMSRCTPGRIHQKSDNEASNSIAGVDMIVSITVGTCSVFGFVCMVEVPAADSQLFACSLVVINCRQFAGGPHLQTLLTIPVWQCYVLSGLYLNLRLFLLVDQSCPNKSAW